MDAKRKKYIMTMLHNRWESFSAGHPLKPWHIEWVGHYTVKPVAFERKHAM